MAIARWRSVRSSSRAHALVHLGLEEPIAALAVALGPVHRGVGVPDQLLGARGGSPPPRRRCRCCSGATAPAATRRAAPALQHAVRRVGGLLDAVDVLEQQRELVAAEARRGVGRADARGQALRHLDEHLVAGGVPQAVVDRLEVVEVEEDHGHALALAARAGDRMADALGEQGAVRQAGHRVVEGLVGELLLEGLALEMSRQLRTMPPTCSSPSRFVQFTSNWCGVPSRCTSVHWTTSGWSRASAATSASMSRTRSPSEGWSSSSKRRPPSAPGRSRADARSRGSGR